MKISFRLPFAIVKTSIKDDIEQIHKEFKRQVETEKLNIKDEYRRMIHNAYAGIVCDECGKNVFRGEGTWVHGNGGKAYCLDPCWKKVTQENK